MKNTLNILILTYAFRVKELNLEMLFEVYLIMRYDKVKNGMKRLFTDVINWKQIKIGHYLPHNLFNKLFLVL